MNCINKCATNESEMWFVAEMILIIKYEIDIKNRTEYSLRPRVVSFLMLEVFRDVSLVKGRDQTRHG